MQIGSATTHVAPSPAALSARAVSSAEFAGPSSPDLNRTNQAPATPAPSSASGEQASLREEADRPETAEGRKAQPGEAEKLRQDQAQIADLASRDREVRTHEQAHASVGGAYAGSPTYSFKRGPDGRSYAVGGEVGIDVSPIPNDPEATLRKMEVVQRAALAPADPSAQDRRVAAQAQAQATEARAAIVQQRREEAVAAAEERRLRDEQRKEDEEAVSADEEEPVQQPAASTPSLEVYRNLSQLQEPAPALDLRA
ncbi:MAG: putative metalloprotease CJM1_0395 family protein [Pseudomonas sp.]